MHEKWGCAGVPGSNWEQVVVRLKYLETRHAEEKEREQQLGVCVEANWSWPVVWTMLGLSLLLGPILVRSLAYDGPIIANWA